jgi:hypothetical protein
MAAAAAAVAKVDEKEGRVPTTLSRSSTHNTGIAVVQGPGAYSVVQGQSMQRHSSGVLSPQAQAQAQAPQHFQNTQDLVVQKVRVPKLVVAAKLSMDIEEELEQKVRARLLQEAVRADVVSVEHSARYTVDNEEEAKRIAAFKELHKPRGVKEKLFGDSRSSCDMVDIAAAPECIRKRDVLKWSLKRNKATNLWLASVTTSQRALENDDAVDLQRSVRSYTADTQKEAFETGLANAVPRMLPFEDNPICFVCKSKFAMLRRPCHCRNCGVCICTQCSTSWPSKMVPETYNTKNEGQVKVCLACDWLCTEFQEALVTGRYKAALDLYATGNVNLRTPYCSARKSEVL